MTPEERVAELGLALPDYADPPYGARYGDVKAAHRIGTLVQLGGITAEDRSGTVHHPGIVGRDLGIPEAEDAARLAAINSLGMLRFVLGSLDEVRAIARLTVFVAATPEFAEHHLVTAGASGVYRDVFGEAGVAARATMGVSSLANRNCVELVLDVETRSPA